MNKIGRNAFATVPICFAIVWSGYAIAGDLSVKGRVTVDNTNETAAGLPVLIEGASGEEMVVYTDKSGIWSAYNLPPGDYKAKIFSGEEVGDNAEPESNFTLDSQTKFPFVFQEKNVTIVDPIRIAPDVFEAFR